MWQDAGVILVVGGAVYYLARKLLGVPGRRKAPPPTFIPLSEIKKRRP
jgi:hypothetical protein